MANKVLIMITQRYPFGKGENYLNRETEYFLDRFDTIDILPLNSLGEPRKVHESIQVNKLISDKFVSNKFKHFVLNCFSICYLLSVEFFNSKHKKFILKNFFHFLNETIIISVKSQLLLNHVKNKYPNSEVSYYSVWMDEGAVMLAMLKRKKLISDFVFRLHGYDIYDERRSGSYMPYRYFCFKFAKKIFVVSQAGKDYLLQKKIFNHKLIVNYSGLNDYGTCKNTDSEIFTIVSCSNIIPLKRVDRMIDVLKLIEFPVRWVHIGEGELIEELKFKTGELRTNVHVELVGYLPHEKLMQFYSENSIDLFIHLSETEGLPLSLVEAQSFGIPVIATNVGGTSEIVNEKNGFLIEANLNIPQIAEHIITLYNNPELKNKLAIESRNNFLNKFSAKKNYTAFTSQI